MFQPFDKVILKPDIESDVLKYGEVYTIHITQNGRTFLSELEDYVPTNALTLCQQEQPDLTVDEHIDYIESNYMTLTEAATFLQISYHGVYQKIKKNQYPTKTIFDTQIIHNSILQKIKDDMQNFRQQAKEKKELRLARAKARAVPNKKNLIDKAKSLGLSTTNQNKQQLIALIKKREYELEHNPYASMTLYEIIDNAYQMNREELIKELSRFTKMHIKNVIHDTCHVTVNTQMVKSDLLYEVAHVILNRDDLHV